MVSVAGDMGKYMKTSRNLQSCGLADVVRMHPDDVTALKAWVMAKRLYEHELISPVERAAFRAPRPDRMG